VVTKNVLAGLLVFLMLGTQTQVGEALEQTQQQPQQIPDAPKPQQPSLPNLTGVTPGKGTTPTGSATASGSGDGQEATPGATLPDSPAIGAGKDDQPEPIVPEAGQGVKAFTIVTQVNFVTVPFTVKDNKGKLVPGLQPRDIRVYENNLRQQLAVFTTDPWPLSVALVIDQSVTQDEMTRVNNSLKALQGAFAPYDEISLYTYNNGPKLVTEATGAQSARLTQALERSKSEGRQALLAGSLGGPLAHTTNINGGEVDPNTQANRGHLEGMELNAPREVHTLNDAILEAAKSLTKAKLDRRRIIYVISDGKEYGSTAKFNEVKKYLQTNNIQVYGTLVGDSAVWGMGFLDRIHLPLQMQDNRLTDYAYATGGNVSADFRQGEIEKSFAKIAEEARVQYTIGYYTHEPFVDGKYRKLDVYVMHPNLTVLARPGYWPAAMELRPKVASVQ
jgi:VWFA-related protein